MEITASMILSLAGGVGVAILGYIGWNFNQLANKVSKEDFAEYKKDHDDRHEKIDVIVRVNQDNINKTLLRISEQLGEIKGSINKD